MSLDDQGAELMEILTKHAMEEDLDTLCQWLVESHPDPFSGGGGPIAFYRRADAIRRQLPDRLAADAFLRLLRPFVAALQDGHTVIGPPPSVPSSTRLALEFVVVPDGLVVSRVLSPDLRGCLGARVEAVNDVPMDRLAATVATFWGCDNSLHVWCRLADVLGNPALWHEVLGQDANPGTVRLRNPDETDRRIPAVWHPASSETGWEPASGVAMPPLDATQVGWGFADARRDVAILRIGSLMRYREAAEVWWASGYHQAVRSWYQTIHPGVEPMNAELAQFVAEVPAATPQLIACLQAMARARTPWLVVDLTESTGGNSVLANMLGYAVFGPSALAGFDEGYQIPRYSPLYAENYGQIPAGDWGPGGYDFRAERHWQTRLSERVQTRGSDAADWLADVPTFRHAVPDLPPWRPHVVAVTGARTYSAGFDILLTLKGLGAHHVGVPSSQAPNCFIDILRYSLPHSRLSGTIAFKHSLSLPGLDPTLRHLEPEVTLTYDQMRTYAFDPAAGVRLALETIRGGRWEA
jgi:hypothetical protein